MITFRPTVKFDKEAMVVVLEQAHLKEMKIPHFPESLKKEIKALLDAHKFFGDDGEIFPLVVQGKTVVLVGIGKKDKVSATALRMTLRRAITTSFLSKIHDMEIVSYEASDEIIEALIDSIMIGGYRWRKYVTKDKNSKTVDWGEKKIFIVSPERKTFQDRVHLCDGVNFARDLVNDNADIVDAAFIEDTVKQITRHQKHVSVEVLNKTELVQKGLNLLLSVNKGSAKPPKLMIVKYQGSSKQGDYLALVGKGITFDSGGLNLKPTGHIETMRADMSGAAAVLGVLKNVLTLGIKKNILFVFALAENAIDGNSYKPGDIVRSYSGKTVEIGNTDAEGRLVLADAITYVLKNYKPERLIDIATLTGACVVALGHDYSGLLSNNDELANKLIHSAQKTDDRLWRLPLYPELKEYIKSQVADIKNIGLPKGAAGTLTGAEFLHQFVGETSWAHLDIAGTAFVDGSGRFYFGHGATGAGVRLLTDYLMTS